ncbi:hypothetical protein [Nonomuraea sp. B5E05]|uniref:hypothetical protein n=1 Tax=Nonomuraea sp. B5E05 TaxID=3153569 RepID=UPI00326053FA
MIAHDLAHDFPAVRPCARLVDVLAVMVRDSLPGVVVLDSRGRPQGTISLPEVLDLLLPWPFRESPNLAKVFPAEMGDDILAEAARRPIGDLLLSPVQNCRVGEKSTTLEVVTAMSRRRSPLATVPDARGGSHVISAHRLFERLIQACDEGSTRRGAGYGW